MKITIMATALFLIAVSAYGQTPNATSKGTRDAQATLSQDGYVITTHTNAPTEGYGNLRDELYTIAHGAEILKVRYSQSQTSSAKPGDAFGTGLHEHSSDSNPDLSQIPAAGVVIRACRLAKDRMPDGSPIIDRQPTPAPCMARFENVLQYKPSPNSGNFTYVAFEILSETTNTPSIPMIAQSVSQTPVVARYTLSRKDIPTIAKAANGAIVTITIGDKDRPIALGTGFFINETGAIMTNYHVIRNGDVAIAELPDGRTVKIDGVLTSDKIRDIAIIKAHGDNFRALSLGNSDRLQVGDEVVAIGSPRGLESTVSNGIVSAIRTVEGTGKILQITAPISHGSSGGPLFNMAGEVVGITSSGIEEGENLNFAIPINDAKKLLLSPQRLVSLPNEPIRDEPPKETEEVKPEEPPQETPQQKLDRRALDQVHEYFTYKGESPSGSYIVSVARPNSVLAVAILFDNGTIGVQVIPMGMKNRKGLDEGDFDAFFVPRYIPTREDQKLQSKMDPNHPLDMTPKIICSVSGRGDMFSCDSKEDFDDAMLHLYGLDVNKPSIPIR